MRTTRLALVTGLASTALVGCALPRPGLAPLASRPARVAELAGTWSGAYAGSDHDGGRGGSILFKLTAGGELAFGDVLMIPIGSTEPAARAATTVPQRLTIHFMPVAGDSVRGMLDPYEVPGCRGALTTVFVGRVVDGRIEGTFRTYGDHGDAPQTGTWSATRFRP
jgi:hypothetical protein